MGAYYEGKSEGRHEKYIEIREFNREHPSFAIYEWNENGDIQYIWRHEEIHVESVAGGTTLGIRGTREATAAELELYIKKKEHDRQK